MVDSTPFLSHPTPSELDSGSEQEDSKPSNNSPSIISIDDLIERCSGDFGWPQFLQAFLVSAANIFDAQQSFISVFADADPTWHCTTPVEKSTALCDAAAASDAICHLPPAAWSWDSPAWTSIKSDWNLQCAAGGYLLGGLPASSFFAGCFIGNFVFTTLADSALGRKNLLLLSCLIMCLSSLMTAASTNIWMYAVLRFVCGFGRAAIGSCVLVLGTEVVGKRWRGQVGIFGFSCFTIGFLSLPVLAYANRLSSWRALYLWTSVPAVFYCVLVYFFVCESPRWLFTRGRKGEALATLRKLTKSNTSNSLSNYVNFSIVEESAVEASDVYASLNLLIRKPWAFRRMMAVMVLGLGVGIMYYGMPLGVGNLGSDIYWSTALNAISEIPSCLLTFLFIGRWNRRVSLLVFNTVSGISSIACGVVGNVFEGKLWGLQVALELVSFCSGYLAFSVVLIYTLELFPTCVRNSAVSLVRQAVVLAAIFCPMLVAAGRGSEGLVSYGVFGLVIQLSVVVLAFLPETKGAGFCDTMDEQERKEATTVLA